MEFPCPSRVHPPPRISMFSPIWKLCWTSDFFYNRSQSPVLLLPEAGFWTLIKYLVVLVTSSHLEVSGVGRGMALVVKNPPASAGDVRDTGSVPESGKAPGEGHGDPLQYSCLVNPMDRGAWWATVHRVAKSWTWLKWLSTANSTLSYPLVRTNSSVIHSCALWMTKTCLLKLFTTDWDLNPCAETQTQPKLTLGLEPMSCDQDLWCA